MQVGIIATIGLGGSNFGNRVAHKFWEAKNKVASFGKVGNRVASFVPSFGKVVNKVRHTHIDKSRKQGWKQGRAKYTHT